METRVFLRPLGSPAALGLAGLMGASVVSAGLELGWIDIAESTQVALVLLAFAFPLQIVASVLAFLARDGVAGTALGVLAGTWLCEALVHLSAAPGSQSGALGLLLLASAGLLVAAAVAVASGKTVPAAVFLLTAARFAFLAVWNLGGTETWQDIGGVIGLGVVALAGYTVLATVLEDARARTVLPIGRRGRGLESGEPGVRNQL